MARRCSLTGKGVQTGNNVSHANNKSRRRFLPNIQVRNLYSEALGQTIRIKVAVNTLRSIEKRGGIDAFLLTTARADLSSELVRIRARIAAKQPAAAA